MINCSDSVEESEGDYESGCFTCEWEIGRFDSGDGDAPMPICGAYFESRTEFVEHTRLHIDKYVYIHSDWLFFKDLIVLMVLNVIFTKMPVFNYLLFCKFPKVWLKTVRGSGYIIL